MKQSYRQIHMDFHTSEHIPNVSEAFDAVAFADMLKTAYVDSVTCFARCHHGWLYYPSLNRPDLVHPHLINKNLLVEQIDACHERGIKVPIYTTVQWDEYILKHHPEWLAVDENGNYINSQDVPEPHFYYTICLNSDYRAYFKAHLHDIINVMGEKKVDGFFMDILFTVDCHCDRCFQAMLQKDLDRSSRQDRVYYSLVMLNEFKTEITAIIKKRVPHASIFYNSSHIGPNTKQGIENYTHVEIESLPSGGWGYDHFPATMRYARNLQKEVIGMTGKFHTYWGDFHSLKNKAALEFECFHMLALGAGCSIGDQLHPDGELSKAAYRLIGEIYTKVKEVEDYCRHTRTISEIGVLTPEEFYVLGEKNPTIHPSLIGVVRMLQELSYQFDVIDSRMNFNHYRLIILPDVIHYSASLEKKLLAFKEKGGSVVGSHRSVLNLDRTISKVFGNRYKQEGIYDRDFILPNERVGKYLPKEAFVMYMKGTEVEPVNSKVLMNTIQPYFNREGETFCSHQHAPSSGEYGMPAITRFENAVYFAHPVFGLYRKNRPLWCKQLVREVMESLLPSPILQHNGPSHLITSVAKKNDARCIHILNYIPLKNAEDIYTIEEVIPIHDVEFSLFVGDKRVCEMYTIPDKQQIKYISEGGCIRFRLRKLDGYTLLKVEFKE